MAGCTVTLENSSVVVICTFTNPSVMGYLVLLRFRDEDILNVYRSQDVMSPVVFEEWSSSSDSVSYHGGGWNNWDFCPVLRND